VRSNRRYNKSKLDVRRVARKSLSQMFEPLMGFAMDAGLSIQDLYRLIRDAAVRNAAARQTQLSGRVSISGISASTGVSRPEISSILNSASSFEDEEFDQYQQSTNRILSAWHREPKFTTKNGQPAELKIYGRGASFEGLVKLYAKGIPTRAVLDELARTNAIEITSAQTIRPRSLVAIERGATPETIRSYGDRATALLSAMLDNMRNPEHSAFVASIASSTVFSDEVPLLRREISSRGSEYLDAIQDLLAKPLEGVHARRKRSRASTKLSLTVFYSEKKLAVENSASATARRRNLRRFR
jgi:hypothetical protein